MAEPGWSRARRTKCVLGILRAATIFLAAFSIATASASPESTAQAAAAQIGTPHLDSPQDDERAEPNAMRLKLTHVKAHASPGAKLSTLRDLAQHDRRRLVTFSESRRVSQPAASRDDTRFGHREAGTPRHGRRSSGGARRRGGAAVDTPLVSNAPAGDAQYVVDFEFGTPPTKSRLVVDTGSDLLWTKCRYRSSNRKEKRSGYFHADNSSTFVPVRCRTNACLFMPTSSCSSRLRGLCAYNYTYDDGSMAGGILSFDTVSVKGVAIKNVAFGCTDIAMGKSFSASQGVLGLGGSFVSFSSQVGPLYGNKFSYCLVDHIRNPTASNFLVFGDRRLARAQHRQMQSTPLLTNPNLPTFYYLQIKSLHVNGKRLSIPNNAWRIRSDGGGGTVIDSGTSLNFLLKPAFDVLYRAFDSLLPHPRVNFDPFPICFNNTSVKHPYPDFWIVLEGGARFQPPVQNYIIETYKGSGVSCLAFLEAAGEFASNTVGNILQQNFIVEYDRGNSRLRFAPTDCSRC